LEIKVDIGKEQIKIFIEKLYSLGNKIIPGVICLDIFFGIGFFSKTIFNLYSFIQFLFWAIIISLFFDYGTPTSLTYTCEEVIKEIAKTYKKEPNYSDQTKEHMDNNIEYLQFIFNTTRILIIFLINLLLINISSINPYILNNIYTRFIIAFFLSYFVNYPIGLLIAIFYKKFLLEVYMRYHQ
jgi:hypothetical protein